MPQRSKKAPKKSPHERIGKERQRNNPKESMGNRSGDNTTISSGQKPSFRYWAWGIAGCLTMLYLAEIIWSAWVCDDAYITFRTIDNFVNGLGLTWNPTYRVQTYTHPLWMFLNCLFYLFTRNAFFNVTILSIVISLSVILVVAKISQSPYRTIAAVLTLILSKAFVDYSTSGMENVLSHLVVGIFVFVYAKQDESRDLTFWLSVLVSLSMLTRLDIGLVVVPAYLFHVFKHRSAKTFIHAMIGLLPIIMWILFSLFYYGFAFPNTAYAKLNTGLDKTVLWKQGIEYIWSTARIDPITLSVVLMGVTLPTVFKRSLRFAAFSVGILLYVLYVMSFGGDFMTGRFLTVPFFAAVCIVTTCAPRISPLYGALVIGFILIIGATPDRSPIRFNVKLERLKDHSKIEDERAFYMNCASLHALDGKRDIPDCVLAEKGRAAKEKDTRIAVEGSVGFFGYFAGPKINVVDRFALADPLLARLPMERYDNWRIGHFRRKIPAGYLQSIQNEKVLLEDKDLEEYYQKLLIVIKGDLFSLERITEIIRFNTGQHDHLIDPEKYR